MKKLLLVGLLALGGCANLQNDLNVLSGSSVTPQQVVVAGNAFDAVEATATTYLKLPGCPATTAVPVCRSAAAAVQIAAAIRTGRAARNAMEGFVNAAPGTPAPVSNYNTLMTAISTLQSLLSQYNVAKQGS